MTTKSHGYPTRVRVDFQSKSGWIVLDQIRTVDKKRLTKKLGSIDRKTIQKVKSIIISEFHGLAPWVSTYQGNAGGLASASVLK